jgi:hypothetical protein
MFPRTSPAHSAVRLRSPFCSDSLHGATAIHTVTEALQELFVRASARRAERRLFDETLRKILEQRLLAQPLLLLRIDRRLVARET